MSTFNGKIIEIENISVDRFDAANADSQAYFLSHCHKDHMVGLNGNFFESLKSRNVFLYASQISVLILEKLFPNSENCMRVLPSNDASLVKVEEEYVTVTTIPAGHCPGSVMFLFEKNKSRILYTGDFRIDKNDIGKFNQFRDINNEPIKLDKIYLDTTFLNKKFEKFPSRTESTEAIGRIIDSWINQGPKYQIYLQTCAKYGSENLFASIHNMLNKKIHVTPNTYHVYKHIPELSSATTPNFDQTQVHSCQPPCEKCSKSDFVRTIKPSAMYWDNININGGKIHFSKSANFVRICYSCHASYEELQHFIQYLQPKAIHACVLPNSIEERKTVNEILLSWTKTYTCDKNVTTLNNLVHKNEEKDNILVKKQRTE